MFLIQYFCLRGIFPFYTESAGEEILLTHIIT